MPTVTHPYQIVRQMKLLALADSLESAISASRDFQHERHDDLVVWTTDGRVAAIVLYQGGVLRVTEEQVEGQTR